MIESDQFLINMYNKGPGRLSQKKLKSPLALYIIRYEEGSLFRIFNRLIEYIHICILNRIMYFYLYLLESSSLNYLPAWLAIKSLLPL